MNIVAKTVVGRRDLTFASLDDVVADAETVVASPNVKMLGNWPLDRLLSHLALAVNGSVDGIDVRAPWYIRLVGQFVKPRIFTRKMSPGFNLPRSAEAGFFPPSASTHEALDRLRTAIARTRTERMTAAHPVLGSLTHQQWTQLHLRHAEMHLSFAVPSNDEV